jgi:hypothetical protein
MHNAEQKLLEDLVPLIEYGQVLCRQAYRLYLPKVDTLIKNNIRDEKTIEALLDRLLSFCGDEQMLSLFKKLCRYYWDINPEATADYIGYYREMFEVDGDEE